MSSVASLQLAFLQTCSARKICAKDLKSSDVEQLDSADMFWKACNLFRTARVHSCRHVIEKLSMCCIETNPTNLPLPPKLQLHLCLSDLFSFSRLRLSASSPQKIRLINPCDGC